MKPRRCRPEIVVPSAFAGFRFPPEVIMLAVRWYLRFGLSYRDVEELLSERGVEVDHVTIYRWVIRFTPLLLDAARLCRHGFGDRWHVDETYVRVAGEWRYVYRAVDQHGQVIDVYISARRDGPAAKKFFVKAIKANGCEPAEVVTDKASTYPGVLDDRIENDHGRLNAWLRPMRGLKQDRSAHIIIAGHALIQNLRRIERDSDRGVSPTARPASTQRSRLISSLVR